MNYIEINAAILGNRDIDEKLVPKTEEFYEYLLNNKVAYYYSKYLSKHTTDYETYLIGVYEKFLLRYEKSVLVLDDICSEQKIDYMLYKTHKVIPEINDGDIDVFVRPEQFNKFLDAFRSAGFEAIEDEPGKGKCERSDLSVIEPHTSASWRGGVSINPADIWASAPELVNIQGRKIPIAPPKLEVIALVAKVLYEPDYYDLYSVRAMTEYKKYDNRLDDSLNVNALIRVSNYLNNIDWSKSYKAPIFLPNKMFFEEWTNVKDKPFSTYLRHLMYFIYWKYRYPITNKLPFTHHHEWQNVEII